MYLISIQKEQTNGLQPRTDSFVTEHSTISPNWPNDWAVFWVLICTDNLTVCSYHVTYPFQRESTLYSCLNVKELLAPGSREIWSLSECNWTRTYNYLFRKWTLNHLAKLAKWLSCVLSTYLYGEFNCIFLSRHVPVSERIHTLQLPECQGIPCFKQPRNLKFKWMQLDSNLQLFSS